MKSLSLTPVNGQKTDSFSENDATDPIKVALVDDDENERLQMTRALNQSPDLESVGSYSSGLEALEKIPSSASQIVLLDVRMPGMSGIECTRRLKVFRPHLIIILITGFDHPDYLAKGRRAGADGYLIKPFSLGRFFEVVTVCLPPRKPPVNETQVPRNFVSARKEKPDERTPIESSELSRSDPCADNSNQHEGSSPTQEQGQLTEGSTVRKALLRMVMGLEENFHTREDLFQEACVHFWLTTRQRSGQRLGWYLQNVRFHLHHLMVSGRSLDSPKRRGARAAFSECFEGWDQWRDILELDEGIMSTVNADDILSLMLERLEPIDQTILRALAEGIGVRELAARLKISHQRVIRGRKRIAAIAIELGVAPPLASSILSSVAT